MHAAKDFVIWMVMMLQTLTQVSSAGTDLPPSVKAVTDFLKILQIEMPSVPRECIEGFPPFTIEAATFLVSLVLLALLASFFWKKLAKGKKRASFDNSHHPHHAAGQLHEWRHQFRNMCFVSLSVLYAPTMNFAWRAVLCADVTVQGAQDAATLAYAVEVRSVVKAYPSYACGTGAGGAHWGGLPVYALAMVVLALFGVAYPLLSFCALAFLTRKRAKARAQHNFDHGAERVERLIDELAELEYDRSFWFFFHLNLLQSLALAFSAGYFAPAAGLSAGTSSLWGLVLDMTVVGFVLRMFMRHQPYPEGMRWKRSIQKLLLVTSVVFCTLGICATAQQESGRDIGALVDLLAWLVLALIVLMVYRLVTSFYREVVLEKVEKTTTADPAAPDDGQPEQLPEALAMALSKCGLLPLARRWAPSLFKTPLAQQRGGGARLGRTSKFASENPMHGIVLVGGKQHVSTRQLPTCPTMTNGDFVLRTRAESSAAGTSAVGAAGGAAAKSNAALTVVDELAEVAEETDDLAVAGGGWATALDEDGNTYYYNEQTGETSWDPPASTGADQPQAQPQLIVPIVLTAATGESVGGGIRGVGVGEHRVSTLVGLPSGGRNSQIIL